MSTYAHPLHFFPGDELHLPKVMTDTDTGASVSTEAGGSVLKRVRSRHYLNGESNGSRGFTNIQKKSVRKSVLTKTHLRFNI